MFDGKYFRRRPEVIVGRDGCHVRTKIIATSIKSTQEQTQTNTFVIDIIRTQ